MIWRKILVVGLLFFIVLIVFGCAVQSSSAALSRILEIPKHTTDVAVIVIHGNGTASFEGESAAYDANQLAVEFEKRFPNKEALKLVAVTEKIQGRQSRVIYCIYLRKR